jgi:mono/diheme cytochrome c family protein
VSSALSSTRIVRVVLLAIPFLTPVLSGCDESYPADMTYPSRSDPIVTGVPKNEPWNPTGPGQLDTSIAHLNDLGGETLDPKKLSDKDRNDLDKALVAVFGSPAAPTVKGDDSESQEWANELKLDKDTLKAGSVLYRRHCMHCHGVTGDGRGPTGPWVSPHPRDYRQGEFKFISSDLKNINQRKPRRQDLHRTLDRGIEGTSMPSFGLLLEEHKEQLISYIIHLSIRGWVEMNTMQIVLAKKGLEGTIGEYATSLVKVDLENWIKSNRQVLEPTPYPYPAGDKKRLADSIRHGYELFTNPKGDASCIGCHLDYGRQVPFKYDKWGTLVRPANLTAGVYRGGRRPLDLYWRIRGGIPPSGMSAAPLKVEKDRDEFWDVVNFVQALPYPHMLPEDIRDRIYARPKKAEAKHAQR